jgi:hypothetical protein
VRIALLGDSFLFGSGVRDDGALFANLLGARLGPRYEVMNLGAPGLNTKAEIGVLDALDPILHFDKAILFYFPNDAEPAPINDQNRHFFESLVPGRLGRFLATRSRLYYFLETRTERLLERLGLRASYGDYLQQLYQPGPALTEHRELLRSFLASFEVGTIAVVIIPVLHDLQHYGFAAAHRYVRDIAAATGVPVVDLLDAFRGRDARELIVGPYDFHMNPEAHRITAAYVYEALAARGFLALADDAAAAGPTP